MNLNVKEEIKKAIEEMGYEELMEIQEKIIPYILKGNDVIGQAKTGTGKTAAFGIPLAEMSHEKNSGIEHIILSPTRELAIQIKKELEKITKYTKIKVIVIVGGTDYTKEIRTIKTNPNIVVATPGRLLDHLNNHRIDISNIASLTIDEADEMLEIGFKEDLHKIIDFMPKKRQSMLFSATMNKGVLEVAEKLLSNPVLVSVSQGLETQESIKQYGIILEEREKLKTLVRLLELEKPRSVLIFGRTKKRVDELTKALNDLKINARGLHGDLSQRERERIMEGFKKREFPCLVATDVAARGIHVDNINIVFNFDLPQEIEYYVHRIGRTGRAGNVGKSISFVRKCELEHIRLIEEKTKSQIEIITPPSTTEVKKVKTEMIKKDILKLLDDPNNYRYLDVAEELLEKSDAKAIIAALISKINPKVDANMVTLSGEPPVRIKEVRRPLKKRKDSMRGFKKDYMKPKKNDFSKKNKKFEKRH